MAHAVRMSSTVSAICQARFSLNILARRQGIQLECHCCEPDANDKDDTKDDTEDEAKGAESIGRFRTPGYSSDQRLTRPLRNLSIVA